MKKPLESFREEMRKKDRDIIRLLNERSEISVKLAG